MKALVVFLSGFTATVIGAFIRSCSDRIPAEFANAWCGASPPHLASLSHAHCAGCAMIATGLSLLAIAPLFNAVHRPASQKAHR